MNGIDTNSTSGFHTIDEWLEMTKDHFHTLRPLVSVERFMHHYMYLPGYWDGSTSSACPVGPNHLHHVDQPASQLIVFTTICKISGSLRNCWHKNY
jgi:hypothetical protein